VNGEYRKMTEEDPVGVFLCINVLQNVTFHFSVLGILDFNTLQEFWDFVYTSHLDFSLCVGADGLPFALHHMALKAFPCQCKILTYTHRALPVEIVPSEG
jgi:hypothetical protein